MDHAITSKKIIHLMISCNIFHGPLTQPEDFFSAFTKEFSSKRKYFLTVWWQNTNVSKQLIFFWDFLWKFHMRTFSIVGENATWKLSLFRRFPLSTIRNQKKKCYVTRRYLYQLYFSGLIFIFVNLLIILHAMLLQICLHFV